MRQITIAERLMPFSHQPGTLCVLPGTSFCFEIFPALIRVYDLSITTFCCEKEIKRDCQGPVDKFTIQLNLEKGKISVWGESLNGFFRYHIQATEDGKSYFILEDKEKRQTYIPPLIDRLSLGNHKAQDWEMICRRQNLAEIFPIWLRLGQLVPSQNSENLKGGTLDFFQWCQGRELQPFLNFFHTAFKGMLVPTLKDEKHQGFALSEVTENNPLAILSEGAKLIRALFFQIHQSELKILPLLPVEFHAGRFINLQCSYGLIDLEWTKKRIRCLHFHTTQSSELTFTFQKDLKRCRLRQSEQDRGRIVELPLTSKFESNQNYYFDNFEG